MCGRFTLSQSAETIAEVFQLSAVPQLEPRYNIAPTQPVCVIRTIAEPSEREFTYLYWGLIPSWAKDPSIGTRLINARAETVTEKPAFRAAFKRRRCLILADGFYEWQPLQKGKQPFYFQMEETQPFAFAGLWEHWESADGAIESCTILTTEANEMLKPIHDRMPVILPPNAYDMWLNLEVQGGDRLHSLLRPYSSEAMSCYPVSLKVNNPRYDHSDCIHPLEQE
ncbi:MAG: SOS response-associated peptidase [Cyanobacteria bacterium CRU_2_1]|nr:SOS response-associated peptidase [Cyanobacteria bacterium RU_5_0]NJR61569.1 SOS response-associated peptidase [Cyanobacteria bacterium CRU_2_1]